MKVLLQCCKTGKFLCANGEWKDDPESALDHERSLRALEAINQQGLMDVRVFFKFATKDLDIPMACMDATPGYAPTNVTKFPVEAD